jgi:single-strand DNA-binding protein
VSNSNNINAVWVNGRLTDDPKLYDTSGENVYAILPLAINSRKRDGSKGRTIFYDVKVWNGLARACVDNLSKGRLVSVLGHLDQYDKPDEDDPTKKKRWNYVAGEEVEFVGARNTKDSGDE